MDFKNIIRDVQDFPHEGILFRDITPLLKDPESLKSAVSIMADELKGIDFDYVVGPESRGFIFGVPVAYVLNKGFVPVRKTGKLPAKTIRKAYSLEYGEAVVEIHADAIETGQRVVIVDDLLATGGTCRAICELVEEMGGTVAAIVFLVELNALNGREILKKYNVRSLVQY